MIKHVVFLARLYAPHVGGVEKHLQKVCHYLHRQNIKTTIITEQYQPTLPLTETINGSNILRIPFTAVGHGWLPKLKLWWWMMLHLPLFFKASVVHIHDVFWWLLPFSLVLRPKLFITFHGYEGTKSPEPKAKRWHQVAALMTSGNLCIGGFHTKWYGVYPSKTSFGAVEKSLLVPQTEQVKLQKSKSPITNIIFVGRLAEDTGIMTYLKGFALLVESAQANKKYMLDVFGAGPQLLAAKQYAKDLDLPVTFHGFVENAADNINEYQIAFISRHLAILEALAQGVPVVAHYNNEIKEDYLRLTPFKDWISIVHSEQQVAKAVDEPLEMTAQAFEWVSKQTWEKMVDDYEGLWAKT